jgi:hypothetical protein
MIPNVMILKLHGKSYMITLNTKDRVIQSNIPALMNKTSTDVWRTARLFRARVYIPT